MARLAYREHGDKAGRSRGGQPGHKGCSNNNKVNACFFVPPSGAALLQGEARLGPAKNDKILAKAGRVPRDGHKAGLAKEHLRLGRLHKAAGILPLSGQPVNGGPWRGVPRVPPRPGRGGQLRRPAVRQAPERHDPPNARRRAFRVQGDRALFKGKSHERRRPVCHHAPRVRVGRANMARIMGSPGSHAIPRLPERSSVREPDAPSPRPLPDGSGRRARRRCGARRRRRDRRRRHRRPCGQGQ